MSKRPNGSSCKCQPPTLLWSRSMSWLCAVDEESPHKTVTTSFKRPSVGILRRASAFMQALQRTRADPDHSKDVDQFTQINYSYKKMTESACFVSLCQSLRRRPLMECAPNRQKPLSAVCSYQREIRRLECSHFLFILFSIMKTAAQEKWSETTAETKIWCVSSASRVLNWSLSSFTSPYGYCWFGAYLGNT